MSTVLAGVFLLGVLVFVHELGHFLVAKATGVRVLTFSLGFGPRLFGFQRGDTDYRVSAIPLGGYVRMYGDDPGEEVPESEASKSFLHKPLLQKSAIAFAGPAANFLLPVGLFFFLLLGTEKVPSTLIGGVVPGEPAASAGLLPGDRIVAVDGVPVGTMAELQDQLAETAGRAVPFEVDRGGARRTLTITPRAEKSVDPLGGGGERGHIGIASGVPKPFVAVAPTSPAALAGLRTGDLIEEVNGEAVASIDELKASLARHRNQAWTLKVRSGGLPPSAKPTPSAREDENQTVDDKPVEVEQAADATPKEEVRTVTVPLGPVLEPGSLYPQPVEVDRSGVTRDELASQKLAEAIEQTRRLLRVEADAVAASRGIGSYQGVIDRVGEETVAARLGVEGGDRAVAMNGRPVYLSESLVYQLLAGPDDVHVLGLFTGAGEARLLVFRMEGGKRHGEQDFKTFGVRIRTGLTEPAELLAREVGVGEALSRAVERTGELMVAVVRSLGMLVTGKASFSSLGGPITIVSFAGQAAEQGFSRYLELMAFISVNLGIVNLLPIPVLDGGHLLMFGIEGVTRRRLDLKTRERAMKVGLTLLLVLIVGALVNDFLRLLF